MFFIYSRYWHVQLKSAQNNKNKTFQNKYIKPSYLGADHYRAQAEKFCQFCFNAFIPKWRKTDTLT